MKALLGRLYLVAKCMAVHLHLICCSDHAVITREQAHCLGGSSAIPTHLLWEQPGLMNQPRASSFIPHAKVPARALFHPEWDFQPRTQQASYALRSSGSTVGMQQNLTNWQTAGMCKIRSLFSTTQPRSR